jgi:predicted transcriptional regulator
MILNIRVGEPQDIWQSRIMEHARKIDAGEDVEPLCGVGFQNMAQMGVVFSPKRWELVETLKKTGAQSIYALAKRLGRHYRNVYQDVAKLSEWLVIEKDETGKVFVPWDEIDVQWPLQQLAA